MFDSQNATSDDGPCYSLRPESFGKERLVPLMRVEHQGSYAMIASKGGAPEHPAWYANVRANPEVTLQDGTAVANAGPSASSTIVMAPRGY